MNKAPPTRWYTPWRSPAARQDDWADLGTAFGLDLSMDGGTPAVPEPQTKPRSSSWMRRLTTRRREPA